MSFDIKPLPFPASTLNGLSEKLIASHHENNYSGAVKRLNAIHTKLGTLDFTQEAGFLLNGLKREELIAYNSMLLHEIYFDSLGGNGVLPVGPLCEAIERDFGSVERWPNSRRWARRSAAVPAGCCWSNQRATAS